MKTAFNCEKRISFPCVLLCSWLCILSSVPTTDGSQPANGEEPSVGPHERSEIDLAAIPFKIVYETYRETDGEENWELFIMNADGSNAVNLTRTKDIHEMYPHASPDGAKICFVADEGAGRKKVRNVHYMNVDGTERVKVADNARQPCWSPDGKMIAYLKGEYRRYTTRAYGTKGLFYYDVSTGEHRSHPNRNLHHIYNMSWSPEGNWFIATVTGGMGFDHNTIAFEADGPAVVDLKKYGIDGCRPDLSSDGRTLGWAEISEVDVFVAEIDLSMSLPRVADLRGIAKCAKGHNVNHTDFSPDCRYVAFGYGPEANYEVGSKTPGWNICVGDLTGKWVQITTDGKHNKEPDWVPVASGSR